MTDRKERSASAQGSKEPREQDDIFSAIASLPEDADPQELRDLVAELTRTLRGKGQAEVAVARERFLREAKSLSSPAKFFDAVMADAGIAGPRSGEAGVQGQSLTADMPDPWPDPVDGAELLHELYSLFKRHVIVDDAERIILALWTLHTYAFAEGYVTPRLAITSPVKRCGKTLVLTLLEFLVNKPLLTANATAAAVFRAIDHAQPTLLMDEADTFLHGKDNLRGVLNSGHRRGGSVHRTCGPDHETRRFATFAPVAIALIGELPDTLRDRSIEIEMKRKSTRETVQALRFDRIEPFKTAQRKCLRWAIDSGAKMRRLDPAVPPGLNDRAADNWRPLLALADLVGGRWPEAARRACETVSRRAAGAPEIREDLLADLREIFGASRQDRLSTEIILGRLHKMQHRPWAEWRQGSPISAVQLARQLKAFGITPKTIRIGSQTCKGYPRAQFEDAFRRYLPPEPSHPSQPSKDKALPASPSRHAVGDVTARESAETSTSSRVVTGVTAQSPGPPLPDPEWVEIRSDR